MSGLWDCDNQQDPEPAGDGHQRPEDPAPARIATDITAHDQRRRRTKGATQSVNRHGATTCIPLPQITDRSTGVGERRAPCKSSEKATDKHGADVRGQRDGHLEEGQQEPGHDVDGLATKVFGKRRQQDRANRISKHVERKTQSGDF